MTHESYKCERCGSEMFRVTTGEPLVVVVCSRCLNDACGASVTAAFEAISKEKPCPSSPAS